MDGQDISGEKLFNAPENGSRPRDVVKSEVIVEGLEVDLFLARRLTEDGLELRSENDSVL